MSSRLVLIVAFLFVVQGCSLGRCTLGNPATTAPAIGDTCLVGTWLLDRDVNTRGYSVNNVPLEVAGLQGAKMTFTSDGKGVEDFGGSDPLLGTTADGHHLSITLRGTWPFHIHADGHRYVETSPKTPLQTTATVDGQSIEYSSYYTPASGTYTCAKSALTMTTDSGVQTDQWSRG